MSKSNLLCKQQGITSHALFTAQKYSLEPIVPEKDLSVLGRYPETYRIVCSARTIHVILMRVASLEDTLRGKIKARRDKERRQSKTLKVLSDIARLGESHPHLWELLDADLKEIIQKRL